jgi:hypothetical protein
MSAAGLLDIAYFVELQVRTLDIFRYVSCHEKNFSTYSIIIESALVDSGSFFDSLCQTFIRTKSSTGHHFTQESKVPRLADKIIGKSNFNFGDYRVLLEVDFALSGRQVNLNPYEDMFYSNPISYAPDDISGYLLTPFREWASGGASPWWDAFTSLKHDRLKNFRQATLGTVIHTLAAVFIILTLSNEPYFKEGHVSPEIYNLFFPKYWKWNGRVMPGNFRWL